MIYSEPRFLPGGDRYVLIEFGNEMNLELNFVAQGLATAIAAAGTRGIVETAPCFASILIHYEPDELPYDDLVRELTRLIGSLGPSEAIELQSRDGPSMGGFICPYTIASAAFWKLGQSKPGDIYRMKSITVIDVQRLRRELERVVGQEF